MGKYIVAADIKIPAALINYLDGESSATDDAIESAESLADGYIQSKYELPLPRVLITKLLKTCCVSIALYYMWQLTPGMVPETIELEYVRAEGRLMKLSTGELSLGVEERVETETTLTKTAEFKRA